MAIEFVTRVVAALRTLNIPYMVVGSFSSNSYGNRRSTKDADFVIELDHQSISRLSHRSTAFTVELFLLSDDAHDQERFKRRRVRDIGDDHESFVPSPEDVVVAKLRRAKGGKRSKHIADAKGIVDVQAGQLDEPYLRHWCDIHRTRDLWTAC